MSDDSPISPDDPLDELIKRNFVFSPYTMPKRKVSFARGDEVDEAEPIPEYEYDVSYVSSNRRAIIDVVNKKVHLLCSDGVEVESLKNDRVHKFVTANGDKETVEVPLHDVANIVVNVHQQCTCKWFVPAEGQHEFVKEELGRDILASDNWKWDRLPETTGCAHPDVYEDDPAKVSACGFSGDMVRCPIYEAAAPVPVKIAKIKSDPGSEVVLKSIRRGLGFEELSFDEADGPTVVSNVDTFIEVVNQLGDCELFDPEPAKVDKVSFMQSILS